MKREFTTAQGNLAQEISRYVFVINLVAASLVLTGTLISRILVEEK